MAIKSILTRLLGNISGTTSIEYGLIATLIGMAIFGGAGALRNTGDMMYAYIVTQISSAVSGTGG